MARNPLSPFGRRSPSGHSDPFMTLHREMNRLFDDVFRGTSLDERGAASRETVGSFIDTSLDVSETEKEFRITAELPGVSEEDIDVRLENEVLTIRGEKKFERAEGGEKEDFHFVERSYGTFQRSLRLPSSVDAEQVRADFRNGVLTITLPKTTEQERSRRIQIKGGQGEPSSKLGQSAGEQGSAKKSKT
jgi:HSP20 family protein